MESGRFLPIKVGEGCSHFGNDDLFFFLCNCFPEWAAVWECLPIPLEVGRLTLGRSYTYIMKNWLEISFGEVADRERKHPGTWAHRERRRPG